VGHFDKNGNDSPTNSSWELAHDTMGCSQDEFKTTGEMACSTACRELREQPAAAAVRSGIRIGDQKQERAGLRRPFLFLMDCLPPSPIRSDRCQAAGCSLSSRQSSRASHLRLFLNSSWLHPIVSCAEFHESLVGESFAVLVEWPTRALPDIGK